MVNFDNIQLRNPNTVCFMNASVQVLLKCESIRNLVKSDKNDGFLDVLRKIVKRQIDSTAFIRHDWLPEKRFNDFNNLQQQDSGEFLIKVIELSPELKSLFEFESFCSYRCQSPC